MLIITIFSLFTIYNIDFIFGRITTSFFRVSHCRKRHHMPRIHKGIGDDLAVAVISVAINGSIIQQRQIMVRLFPSVAGAIFHANQLRFLIRLLAHGDGLRHAPAVQCRASVPSLGAMSKQRFFSTKPRVPGAWVIQSTSGVAVTSTLVCTVKSRVPPSAGNAYSRCARRMASCCTWVMNTVSASVPSAVAKMISAVRAS